MEEINEEEQEKEFLKSKTARYCSNI